MTGKTRNRSLAISDTVGLFDDTLLVTYGVRRQQLRVENYKYDGTTSNGVANPANDGSRSTLYDEAVTTPVYGIVYKPVESVSLYANRIEGLAKGPVASGSGITNLGQAFPLAALNSWKRASSWTCKPLGPTWVFSASRNPPMVTSTTRGTSMCVMASRSTRGWRSACSASPSTASG